MGLQKGHILDLFTVNELYVTTANVNCDKASS